MPLPRCPAGSVGSSPPYMYAARRAIAGPATTFSETACSMKPQAAADRHTVGRRVVRQHAAHPAEMVGVAVAVEDRAHRPVPAVLPVQSERGGRGLPAQKRVDDEDAGRTLDDRHVRQVHAAHLVDALGHLVEAVQAGEPAMPPQRRMRGLRAVGVQEAEAGNVPRPSGPRCSGSHRARAGRSGRARRRRGRSGRRNQGGCSHPPSLGGARRLGNGPPPDGACDGSLRARAPGTRSPRGKPPGIRRLTGRMDDRVQVQLFSILQRSILWRLIHEIVTESTWRLQLESVFSVTGP